MKFSRIMILLIIFAWPLYYLYQRQLGAVSFLLLAIFFLVLSIKELKKQQEPEEKADDRKKSTD